MEENYEVSLADESRSPKFQSVRPTFRTGLFGKHVRIVTSWSLCCWQSCSTMERLGWLYGAAESRSKAKKASEGAQRLGGSLGSLCSAQVRIMSHSMTKERLGGNQQCGVGRRKVVLFFSSSNRRRLGVSASFQPLQTSRQGETGQGRWHEDCRRSRHSASPSFLAPAHLHPRSRSEADLHASCRQKAGDKKAGGKSNLKDRAAAFKVR